MLVITNKTIQILLFGYTLRFYYFV